MKISEAKLRNILKEKLKKKGIATGEAKTLIREIMRELNQ